MSAPTPTEYGQQLAAQRPPLTSAEVETVARTFVAFAAQGEVAA